MNYINFGPYLSNRAWQMLSLPYYNRFLKSLGHVEQVQSEYLKALIKRNTNTRFGRQHSFSNIRSIKDFQREVPLSDYQDYLEYIEAISEGERNVLTIEPVKLFQPSSGSSSASKFIPYNDTLKREFQRAIATWITSLYKNKPNLLNGRAYWSITPPVKRKRFFGKIQVGFEDDAEYLSPLGKWLYRGVSVIPTSITSVMDMEDFLDRTIVYLLAAPNISLVSVWSPTFLLLLMRRMIERSTNIIHIMNNEGLPGLSLNKNRTKEVELALCTSESHDLTERLWPNLKLISCWADGPSLLYSEKLKELFPHVEIQGKGLVSTEAFVSLPLVPDQAPVLAIDSHFFEFLEISSGSIYLAHQLKKGETYSVIVTTGGGLYRYQIKDLVAVTGFINKAPTIRFIAKESVVDLCGEKLQSDHVQRSANAAFIASTIKPNFFLLAPTRTDEGNLAYCLFFASDTPTTKQVELLRYNMEKQLNLNYHYAHCRQIGQLDNLRLFLINSKTEAPEAVYVEEIQKRGLKLGDIKATHLDKYNGWGERFKGQFL